MRAATQKKPTAGDKLCANEGGLPAVRKCAMEMLNAEVATDWQ